MTTYLSDLQSSLHAVFGEDERVFMLGEDLADPYGGRGERSYSSERLSPEAERDLAEFERADELFDEQDRRMMGGSADPLGGSGPGHGSGRGSGPTPDTRNGREPGSARTGQ